MSFELIERVNKWLKDTSTTLDISNLGLKEWPKCLKGKEDLIIKLDCVDNQIKSIPVLPNLTKLWCYHNLLKSLPVLPRLTYLECNHNKIKSIPILHNLTYLVCNNNRIGYIPILPKLTMLSCENNEITSLQVLPKLTWLVCDNNLLFSNDITDWKKIWKIQNLRKSELRKSGIQKLLKIFKMRLYLPRLSTLHQELIYSPDHPGKFYKNLRIGNWSFENPKNK